MAKQAESEREKRAKIIHASGEFEASKQLTEAAEALQKQPVAIHLRYLQTLTEIAAEKNSTIIFPVPIDWMKAAHGRGQEGSELHRHRRRRRRRDDLAITGEIETSSVPELLRSFLASGETGILTVRNGDVSQERLHRPGQGRLRRQQRSRRAARREPAPPRQDHRAAVRRGRAR